MLTACSTDEARIKYVLLNPAIHFVEIMSSARAVIVAGGTMAPVADLLQHIMLKQERPKVMLWACLVVEDFVILILRKSGLMFSTLNF
jgi:hypothetical protein